MSKVIPDPRISSPGKAKPAADQPTPGGAEFSVIVIEDVSELEKYIPEWQALTAAALEPSIYYESWLLLPALRLLKESEKVQVVLVFRNELKLPGSRPLLCGLFPLERRKWYKKLPVSVATMWKHQHCTVATPLLHVEHARQALAAFLHWLKSDPAGATLFQLPTMSAEGPFYHLLVDQIRRDGLLTYASDTYTRAFLRVRRSADECLALTISSQVRGKMRRNERRIADNGPLEYVEIDCAEKCVSWVENFLRLESSGWKGRAGTALACNKQDEAFFRALTAEASQQGRLLMYGVHLCGRPIALNVLLRSGAGCYCFKSGFDEEVARYSPGRLLWVETIRRLHAVPGVEWADSCTSPKNELLNSLWPDRRTITTLLVSTGRRPGDWLVSVLPLLRWIKQKLFGKPQEHETGPRIRSDEDVPS